MKLIEQNRRVDLIQLKSLAHKCLGQVQDLYPGNWKKIIQDNYQKQIETIMVAKEIDEWEASVMLYNHAKTANEKVFFMAAVKHMVTEKLLANGH